MHIRKTAVLGAGTMGRAIAAHMANAGNEVILLDIVPEDAGNRRNKLAEEALQEMREKGRAFTRPDNARHIECGNFEDDMDRLKECDWVVEAVIEKEDIKKDLFRRVDKLRKQGSIVSSNTSTLPLRTLKKGQSAELKADLFITHFFNPPRQMRLLELVSGKPYKDDEKKKAIREFVDKKLGKTVVEAMDTPGFIGNRLGIFWMLTGLEQALEKNVPVPVADEIMGRNLGFPKTGIFGLFDFIGINLMRELTRSLREQLPEEDAFQGLDKAMKFLDEMEEESFYKKENGKILAWNLAGGGYEEAPPFKMDEENSGLAGLLLGNSTEDAEYARAVLLRTMNYACACLPDIARSVADADTAMRLGFNWEHGPFEMIDMLGNGEPGPAVFIGALEDNGLIPAPFLQRARAAPFYKTQKNKLFFLLAKDGYKSKTVTKDKWTLADRARGVAPVLENGAARLWDAGDGAACFEFTAKMGAISPAVFDLLEETVEKVGSDFSGLMIGHDERHFSAGLNLHLVLKFCDKGDWDRLSAVIRRGQQIMMDIKKAPFPVIGAPSGKALGGGCELLLHCDGIQAHIESHIGLVEPRIGLVPAWGGCKEMLAHHLLHVKDDKPALQACARIFDDLSRARTSSSAQDAQDQLFFKRNFEITMNRERVLPEAKNLCLSLAQNYKPPEKRQIRIPAGAKALFKQKIEERSDMDSYDREVLHHLAHVLSGGDDGGGNYEEGEILNLEHEAFMTLIRNRKTQEKIKSVLG